MNQREQAIVDIKESLVGRHNPREFLVKLVARYDHVEPCEYTSTVREILSKFNGPDCLISNETGS